MSLVANTENPSTKITGSIAITKIPEVNQCRGAPSINNEVAAVDVAVKKDLGTVHFRMSSPVEVVLRNSFRTSG
jgi:hypothetical protein